jgi:hypothetical protein
MHTPCSGFRRSAGRGGGEKGRVRNGSPGVETQAVHLMRHDSTRARQGAFVYVTSRARTQVATHRMVDACGTSGARERPKTTVAESIRRTQIRWCGSIARRRSHCTVDCHLRLQRGQQGALLREVYRLDCSRLPVEPATGDACQLTS